MDSPGLTASVLASPFRANFGSPGAVRLASTWARVVPALTCWRVRKGGDVVDWFRNVIVPEAGSVAAPPKRSSVEAVTVAVERGAARVTSGPVTVNFTGC